MRTPASLWQPSPRLYDPDPTPWNYGAGAELRTLNSDGSLHLGKQKWYLVKAPRRETVQLKWIDQRVLIFFCHTLIREINLAAARSPTRGPSSSQPVPYL